VPDGVVSAGIAKAFVKPSTCEYEPAAHMPAQLLDLWPLKLPAAFVW
jgi:hypothetical protein